uniref:Uncharacterized protein n=1 Tax=Vitis vinifera TaxID=29760 RepID=A5B000_VITVI|nr:hypothetical protein VITISV_026352 [Vitis vinifera]
MRSRVCFDAVHSDRLRLLIEYGMLTVYLPQARDQRQMIQRVGTIEGTFTRCFDMFILGHAPILACWLWFLYMYAGIPFHLAMLWTSEFECLICGLFESFVGNPESHIGAYPFVIEASRALVFASLPFLVRWFLGIAPEFDPLLRYSPRPFFGAHSDPFSVLALTLLWYLPGTFSGTRLNPSPVLARSFFGTCPNPSSVLSRTLFRYSPGPFSGIRLDPFPVFAWTLLRYSPRPFFGTCPNPSPVLTRTLFGYSPEPYSDSCPEPSLVLARTLLRYSPGAFSVLARTLLRYSPEFHHFSVLARTLLRYWPKPFSDTHPDPFSALAQSFYGTCPNPSPALARTLLWHSPGPFSGTRPNSTFFPVLARIGSLIFLDIVIESPCIFLRHRTCIP